MSDGQTNDAAPEKGAPPAAPPGRPPRGADSLAGRLARAGQDRRFDNFLKRWGAVKAVIDDFAEKAVSGTLELTEGLDPEYTFSPDDAVKRALPDNDPASWVPGIGVILTTLREASELHVRFDPATRRICLGAAAAGQKPVKIGLCASPAMRPGPRNMAPLPRDHAPSPCDFAPLPCDFALPPCDFALPPCDFAPPPCDFIPCGAGGAPAKCPGAGRAAPPGGGRAPPHGPRAAAYRPPRGRG